MIALILAFIIWTVPAPRIWICNPGKTPMPHPLSNCQRLTFHVLVKVPKL